MESWSHIDLNSMGQEDAEIQKIVIEVTILYFGRDKNNKINNGKSLSENQRKKFLEWVLRESATILKSQSSNYALSWFAALKQRLLRTAAAKKKITSVSSATSEKKLSAIGIQFKKKSSSYPQLKLDELEDLLNSLNMTSTSDEKLEDEMMAE